MCATTHPTGPPTTTGTRPAVLVVFDGDIAADPLPARGAGGDQRVEINLPLWVSHREAVDALGAAWTRMALTRRSRFAPGPAAPMNHEERQAMKSENANQSEGPRRRGGTDRCPARRDGPLEAARSAEPLPELAGPRDRGQPGYVSTMVNTGRAPSGRIRRRMLKALELTRFEDLFRLEE